jgi:WD40 repeat protein
MFAGLLLPLALAAEPAPPPRPLPDLPPGAIRAFGSSRFRPIAGGLAFSPDRERVAATTGSWSGEVIVWDFATGRRVCSFARGDRGYYDALGFTADGRTIVAVGHEVPKETDGEWPVDVRRYDAATGKELGRVILPGLDARRFLRSAVAPDGSAAFAGTSDIPVGRYDAVSGRVEWQARQKPGEWFVHTATVAVSPDGKRVAATASGDKTSAVCIFDAKTGVVEGRFSPTVGVGSTTFSADGKLLAVGASEFGTAATIWDVATRTQRLAIKGRAGSDQRPAFSADGKLLAVGEWRERIAVYDTATGKEAYGVPLPAYDGSFRFTPDGKALAVPAGSLALYDATTGKLLPSSADPHYFWAFDQLAFSPDGKRLNGFSYRPSWAITWDAATGLEHDRFREDDALARMAGSYAQVSPNGRFRVEMMPDKPVKIVEQATGRTASSFNWPGGPDGRPHVCLWRLSADGRVLFSGDGEKAIRWDAATGKSLGTLADYSDVPPVVGEQGTQSPANPDAWPSPCGRFVVVHPRCWAGAGVPVRVLDPTTGKELGKWESAKPPEKVAWSADGGRFAEVRGVENREVRVPVSQTVTVRDVPSGRLRFRATVHGNGWVNALSPDLRTAVWHDYDSRGTVQLYEVATGRLRHTFEPGEAWDKAAAFSPDGRFLATSQRGVPVLLWDFRGERSRPAVPPDDAGWAKAWDALGGDDAKAAFAAIRLFAAFPEQALPTLKAKLVPPANPDPERVAKLIKQLGAPDFADREAATKELAALGRPVEPALREAAKSDSAEVRDRASKLIDRLPLLTPDDLRAARGVEAVEWIATPEAVKLLEHWAGGPGGARLTAEAKSALTRLKGK